MKNELRYIELQEILNNFKEFLLPKGDKRALVVTVYYTASAYLSEEIDGEYEITDRVKMEILFYNPNNYCKVACRVNDTKFILVADHDSCWRDGVNRCIDIAYEALDESYTKEVSRVLGDNSEDKLRDILSDNEIRISKSVGGISNGFKIIDEPFIKKIEDKYDSQLETNF